eukprot:TRINITY_DN27949_c0_g1_i1.p1 TRINITY_DN27949_c0_g1~~TRINITY_DN27949_c0_g1_i1.p1  ORF type:complete len:261 (-),score=27.01 TRINITY_DN27949_c0_g1_i1:38-793(-)
MVKNHWHGNGQPRGQSVRNPWPQKAWSQNDSRQPRSPAQNDVGLSKQLSRILRHEAVQLGLKVRPDGFVALSEVLDLQLFQSKGVTEEDIRRLVDSNEKKRFGIARLDGVDHIRAHQGHTIKEIEDAELLQEVKTNEELSVLCHGTYLLYLDSIREEGLKSMDRNHIHCVTKDLALDENYGCVLSGTRGEVEAIIYIDAKKAMDEGVVFHRSDNDVVLTRGHDGILPSRLFSGIAKWNYAYEQWDHEKFSN